MARLSGDEFAMIVHGSDPSAAAAAAERVLEVMQAPFVISTGPTTMRVSVGIATTRDGDLSPPCLLDQADLAMYAAKRAGKNRYEVFGGNLVGAA
ncbi:MAG: GGDEF domain-containing protein [Acidimicrobiales bacterium]